MTRLMDLTSDKFKIEIYQSSDPSSLSENEYRLWHKNYSEMFGTSINDYELEQIENNCLKILAAIKELQGGEK